MKLRWFVFMAIGMLLLAGIVFAGDPTVFGPLQAIVPTEQATATPGLLIDNYSADGDSLTISKAGVRKLYVDADGNVTSSGAFGFTNVDASGYIKAGVATPAVITSPGAGDIIASDDLEVIDDTTLGDDVAIGGNITLENGEKIINSTDAQISFTDGTNTLATIIDGGSTGSLTLTGGAEVNGNITLANDETIANSVDNAIAFGFAVGSTTLYGQNAVSTGGDGIDLTQTLLVMDGSDVYSAFDLNLTNADQGGTSHIRGIDLNLNAADAQATESAVYAAGVWDYGMYLDDGVFALGDVLLQNSLVLDGYTAATFKVTDGTNALLTVADAGSTGNVAISGALDVQGGTITMANDETISNVTNGTITMTVAAAGNVGISTGNLAVGDAEATVAMDGEDAFVEGTFEVDGAARFDGAIDANSTLDVSGLSTLTGGESIPINIENLMQPSVLSVPITWTAGVGGSFVLATIGTNEVWVIEDVLVHVTTSWTDTSGDDEAVSIGTSEDVDGFCVLTHTQLISTYAAATGFAEGWACNSAGDRGVFLDEVTTNAYTGGFILESTETIDAVITSGAGDDITDGEATVYIIYTRIL